MLKQIRHNLAMAALWVAYRADPDWISSLMKDIPVDEVTPEQQQEGGEVASVS